jgi:hypothetical protein
VDLIVYLKNNLKQRFDLFLNNRENKYIYYNFILSFYLKIYIHTNPAHIVNILRDGYWKPGSGGRQTAAQNRRPFEDAHFYGSRELWPKIGDYWDRSQSPRTHPCIGSCERPSYGALGRTPNDTNASGYGDVVIELCYPMYEKTTLTHGDSLINGQPLRPANEKLELYKRRGTNFIEAQVWSQIDLLSMAAIHFTQGRPASEFMEFYHSSEAPSLIPVYWWTLGNDFSWQLNRMRTGGLTETIENPEEAYSLHR